MPWPAEDARILLVSVKAPYELTQAPFQRIISIRDAFGININLLGQLSVALGGGQRHICISRLTELFAIAGRP